MKVAIVGQGVIGSSTALAILQRFPKASVYVYGDRPFDKTCSVGPAGLFRLDKPENRKWARASFERFAEIERQHSPEITGVKLVSGHIQSDTRANLEGQEQNFGDIVYNFRWLTDREIKLLFPEPSKYCIHYTAYASEGRRYVPWLRQQAEALGAKFETRKVDSLEGLAESNAFDVVVNAAGLDAGKLAGDDDSVFPVRGIAFEVKAPWHKHFNYRDFTTFTIPMINSVMVGTIKQPHRAETEISESDRSEIWERYLKLHPTLRGAEVVAEWSGIRPDRPSVRLEKVPKKAASGRDYLVIHNYGVGGNGFTLGWGLALDVVRFIEETQVKSKL